MNDTPRRLLLRVVAKLMLLVGAAAVGYILFASLEEEQQQAHTPAPIQLPLTPVRHPTVTRHPWPGGNLLLLQYPADTPVAYPPETRLLDPNSAHARQPGGLAQPQRSLQTGVFLAYDRGTDMGCPLEWVGAGTRQGPFQPWPGGFRDACRGSWYDAAGRVLRGQEARRNLDIPPYRLPAPDLLEVGVNGDNPAPAE
ncbi:MAG: ubiquinol-cytochrome C reductase, iron-sulfur subunit [Gammaproteobacteria bacterium]|nr:ubiquinol-cytochrome C reductase, iron-sulfur subunit [Gammaproteobacteria bacterium]MCW8840862.1 ubiquinol-cytochrome C reductase, iron-sulfur subunit [Gammaproteobacteria bacterium]MCW8928472.1 ubiquinol-cytochrome C reductase, iron-sulfur subunit [Gammaproteobacteria bacterium]MCW8957574.1 ubiquinol-cytochrome C reductase, iron-sulfur subunit [Gammaproteobacteria bacterium]MCW8972863.1 ubiquinol-cytochrome C reductase, iron-sulfur subunit [Gammaproteobacteria bacterium]